MTQFTPAPTNPKEQAVKLNMKKLIKRDANRWALTTVIANLVISVLLLVFEVFKPLMPISVYYFIDSDMGELVQQIVFSVLMFTVPYIIVTAISKQKVKDLIQIKWKKPIKTIPLIMMGLGAAMVINLLVSQFVTLLESYGIDTSAPSLEMPQGIVGAALYVFVLTAVPAVVEEFAFRGLVLGSLKKYGSGYAIIISAVLFGLMHGNIVQIPFATLLGLVMGYVAVATGSIIPCVIIHFLNNLMAGVEEVVARYSGETARIVAVYSCFIAYVIIGIIGFVIVCKKYKHPFDNIKEKGALSVLESTKAALTSGGVITAIIYYGGTACLILLTNQMTGL